MSECNPCDHFMTANARIKKSSCLESDALKDLSKVCSLYMSSIGKLYYISIASSPDLSFVGSSSSQVLMNASHYHELSAKKIFR